MSQLPASSRLARAQCPGNDWADERVYLARIEYWAHLLVWAQQKRSTRGRQPEPLVPEALRPETEVRRIRGEVRPVSEIAALFPIKSKTE